MKPSPRLLTWGAVWCVAAVGTVVWPSTQTAWLVASAVGAALVGVDGMAGWLTCRIEATRGVGATLALGAPCTVILRLTHVGRRSRLPACVWDETPAALSVEGLPARVCIGAKGTFTEVCYRVVPQRRGDYHFGRIRCRLGSPLGLWWVLRRAGEGQQVRIFPNFRAVSRYGVLAAGDKVERLGIHRRQRRGTGMEFHQLREFRLGDMLRQIDWNATSRLNKAIAREYQEERNQQIMLLLDCGRRMRSRDDAYTHLDHALDAALLLSYVAQRQGDQVGLMTFGGVQRWLAPRSGGGHLQTFLTATYDIEATLESSDVSAALELAMNKLHKRSLIIMLTNLRDERDDGWEELRSIVCRRHLLLVASLRESVLHRTLEGPCDDFDSALRIAATHQYLNARRGAHRLLSRAGVMHLDVEPALLPPALVSRYFDIKRGGLL